MSEHIPTTMNEQLEAVVELLATHEVTDDPGREVSFALELTDPDDPACLRWLAAVAIARAAEMESDAR